MTASWIGARHPTNVVNAVSILPATSPNLPGVPTDESGSHARKNETQL
jgi:hypothetical protein